MPVEGHNAAALVFETGRSARIDDYDQATGPVAEAVQRVRRCAPRSAYPITVRGTLWGVLVAASQEEPLAPGVEDRLVGFSELVATAISNAESQAALRASRARLVTAADTTRRRIERDLHDGAQQRLVSTALRLRSSVRDAVPPGADDLLAQLDAIAKDLDEVLEGLREIARGIHPVILAEGGLRPALKALARRSVVPVTVETLVDERLPDEVELAAYYVVAEALTNAAKHAEATNVDVRAEVVDGELLIQCPGRRSRRSACLGRFGADRPGRPGRGAGGTVLRREPPGRRHDHPGLAAGHRLSGAGAVRGSARVVLAGRAI